MNQLKISIFVEVRKEEEFSSKTNDELNKLFFTHLDALRLTLTGFRVLKNIFKAYSFEIEDELMPKHQIRMSKFSYPYYFSKIRLILFSSDDAVMISLNGSVKQFLENYAE